MFSATSPELNPHIPLSEDHRKRLLKRANAAYWSRIWLLISAILAWGGLLLGVDFEGILSVLLLTGMTMVEFKVYAYFLAGDTRGAIYGWWNQCLFALLFVIYGGYHGTYVNIPSSVSSILDADTLPLAIQWIQITYYTIALVGGTAQFSLAYYYRMARK